MAIVFREEGSGPPHSDAYIEHQGARAYQAVMDDDERNTHPAADAWARAAGAERRHALRAENEGTSPSDPKYSGHSAYRAEMEHHASVADESARAGRPVNRPLGGPAHREGANMAITFKETSLASIQATANAPGGPGPGNGSEPDAPDPNRGGPPPLPPEGAAFPRSIRPDVLRRARLRAAALSQFGGAAMVLGRMGAMAEQVGDGVYDLHYDNPRMSAVVRSVGFMDLDESAPPNDEAESWIRENKKEFKRRYGASWRSYLYGKAWKLFGGEKVKKEAGDAHLEIYAAKGGALAFSAYGESPAARDALLAEVAKAVAAGRGLSVLTEATVLEAATEEKGKAKAKPKSDWKRRRSLTDEEKAKLRVPHSEIRASVSHVPNHGYVVHTHRARSNFYKTPGAIPERSIRFISSTA